MTTDLDSQLDHWRQRLENVLLQALPDASSEPHALHEAMRYATLAGGKRLRACLVYITGSTLGSDPDRLDAPAAAVELIHAYSLVHDDLPCMDDDDLRRGKPTIHKQWDEATAMLVGDALQTLAFELLGASGLPNAADLVLTLARASGSRGMAGGQALDLAATGRITDFDELRQIHALKTGALISASVMLGVQAAGTRDDHTITALRAYSQALGLGFQIRDDILDIEGDSDMLGKNTGADEALEKATYPALIGLDGAKRAALEARDDALRALDSLDTETDILAALADFVTNRIY